MTEFLSKQWLEQAGARIPGGPFDSPMEEAFLHELVKHLADDARYRDHEPFDTLFGRFIVDYVVRVPGRTIGFEIDGKDFHSETRDVWRDAAILAQGKVDTIYRIRAADFYRYPHDCLFAIAGADPALVTARARPVLERLAHRYARNHSSDLRGDPESVWLWVDPDEDLCYDDEFDEDEVQRRRNSAIASRNAYGI